MAESSRLFIAGGTYIEKCIEPSYYEVYGSGLRAACAIAEKGFSIYYTSCIGQDELEDAHCMSSKQSGPVLREGFVCLS